MSPDTTLATVAKSIAQGVRAPYVCITLQRVDIDDYDVVAEYRQASQIDVVIDEDDEDDQDIEPLTVPLTHRDEIVGHLQVWPRAQAEPYTQEEQTLLANLADRAAASAHMIRITRDLQRAREHLVLAREEERRRLRRNLHDSIGPTLSALSLKAGAVRNTIRRDATLAETQMNELRDQIKQVIAEIRRVVYDLRPPALDELGMLPAIREQAHQFGVDGLNVLVDAPERFPALSAAVEVAAYRIVLEALSNVSRHAQAQHCRIALSVDKNMQIEVTDDGAGLTTPFRAGVGITSMRERAIELGGTFAIESLPQRGTRISVCLPLTTSDVYANTDDPQPEALADSTRFAVRVIHD